MIKNKKRKCLTIVVTLIPTENSKWIWINEWTETEIETETTATSKHYFKMLKLKATTNKRRSEWRSLVNELRINEWMNNEQTYILTNKYYW